MLSIIVVAQKSPQQQYLDSLKRELSRTPVDSTRIVLLETLGLEYSTISPEKGLYYGLRANKLAKQLGLKNREAATLTVIATNYSAAGEPKKGIACNKQSLEIYKSLKNQRGIAAVNSNLSQDYMKTGNYNAALECNFSALKTYENSEEYRNRAIVLENIAGIYYQLKKYPKSKEFYRNSYILYKKYGSKSDIARCLGNMSRVYMDTEDYGKALEHLNSALKVNAEAGDKSSVLINLTNLGLVHLKMKNFRESLECLQKSLRMSEEMGALQYIAINQGNIGGYYIELFKENGEKSPVLIDSSVVYFSDALKLCDSIAFAGPMLEFTQGLIDAYALKKDYRKAYELQKAKFLLNDSLSRLSSEEKIAALEAERDLNLRDKDIIIKSREVKIEELKSQRRTIIYALSIAALAVIFILVVRYLRKRNRRQTALISEIKQVQSHDIRGPIATILGLARLLKEENRTESSRKELIRGIEEMSLQLNDVLLKVVNDSENLNK